MHSMQQKKLSVIEEADLEDRRKTIIMNLQQYLPLILKEEQNFSRFVSHILKKYDFKVNEENLRIKLHKFLIASYRTDGLVLSTRLVRGQFTYDNDMEWIWIDSEEIGKISKMVIEK